MHVIDSHLHYGPANAEMANLPAELDLKLLNVCVAHEGWRDQADDYGKLARENPGRYAWCTTFDLPGFDEGAYVDRVTAALDRDFAAGAVGCKIWKHVGMELKDPAGQFVLCDHPIFQGVYGHLAKRRWTLLAHIAEPLACWLPLDPQSPHYSYYKGSPKWHMYGRSDVPSHEQLMAARDRIMEGHPTLRVVGAHLGSMEHSLEDIAMRLGRYPNFAIDTSARLGDLSMKPREELIEFITRYQDRILFGTDIVIRDPKGLPWVRETYATERAFYETDDIVQVGTRKVKGLALSQSILRKLFVENAKRWYPGL